MRAEIGSGLVIDGATATTLAEHYGTPLYVYDAETIRAAFRRIDGAVPYAPHKVHYACVANANLAILRLIGALGGGIHANTWGDAVIALQAGFDPADVVYSGSNLTEEDMLNLFEHGIAVNLSSLSQLRNYGKRLRQFEQSRKLPNARLIKVGLRIHLEDQMPYSRMGVKVVRSRRPRRLLLIRTFRLVACTTIEVLEPSIPVTF
jgi:diaminopimelate decarboxylase